MNFSEIGSLISSVGFPIVCVVFMWRFINTTLKDLSTMIGENTKMLTKLYEKMGHGGNNDK